MDCDVKSLLSLIQSNKKVKSIIDEQYFWKLKYERDYPLGPNFRYESYKEWYINQYISNMCKIHLDSDKNSANFLKNHFDDEYESQILELYSWYNYYILVLNCQAQIINKSSICIYDLYCLEEPIFLYNHLYLILIHTENAKITFFDKYLSEYTCDIDNLKWFSSNDFQKLLNSMNFHQSKKRKYFYRTINDNQTSYQWYDLKWLNYIDEFEDTKNLFRQYYCSLHSTDFHVSSNNCIYFNHIKIDFINKIIYWID